MRLVLLLGDGRESGRLRVEATGMRVVVRRSGMSIGFEDGPEVMAI